MKGEWVAWNHSHVDSPVIKISLEMQLAPKELIMNLKSKCDGDIFVHYSLLFYVYDKY